MQCRVEVCSSGCSRNHILLDTHGDYMDYSHRGNPRHVPLEVVYNVIAARAAASLSHTGPENLFDPFWILGVSVHLV